MHKYRPPWNAPYAIVNSGRALSYGHPLKPELTLSNHQPPSVYTKFDYSVPIMGQPSDHKKEYEAARAAAKTAKIAEDARRELDPHGETQELPSSEEWKEYRIRLQEWEAGERELRIRMASKLQFEK